MKFIADFHIHSKFSRATSSDLELGRLWAAAQVKGIQVLGTADFTHPQWWENITTQLEPAEEGLFALKPEIKRHFTHLVPDSCREQVRFMLVTEISNIYKKEGRTRKNHNLVFLPDFDAAERFSHRLAAIGNIHSDGRPILGLPARDLLEIVLETADHGFLVPAHIWTPWFSLLGSKSGFDTVEACFEDLTHHIFALETGLSSDPPMNWRVAALDRFTLISNSDAHSTAKLGREANLFDTTMNYAAIRAALKRTTPGAFQGTLEFFPEEGKYHFDGHRKCNVRYHPRQTRAADELCPVCGKPLTVGVLSRVEDLADRPLPQKPAQAGGFEHLVPLNDLLAAVLQTGAQSKRVAQAAAILQKHIGSELYLLREAGIDQISEWGPPLLAEAISRMRAGKVSFAPGYDGEYGRLHIFDEHERLELLGQSRLFAVCRSVGAPAPVAQPPPVVRQPPDQGEEVAPPLKLNAQQQAVVDYGSGPLMIVAGPGTGKTRTIVCRMAALIARGVLKPENILAITFTNRAADELRKRLKLMLGDTAGLPTAATFHGFCRRQLIETGEMALNCTIVDDQQRRLVLKDAVHRLELCGVTIDFAPDDLIAGIVRAKQQLRLPEDDLSKVAGSLPCAALAMVYTAYQELLEIQAMVDLEDLILKMVHALRRDRSLRDDLRRRFSHIFVDEFQDINHAQYILLGQLAPDNGDICVIGDPDQAIYAFRGSDPGYFKCFQQDFAAVHTSCLTRNYRSTETIVAGATQVIRAGDAVTAEPPSRIHSLIEGHPTISLLPCASAYAEATAIARAIEALCGGSGYHTRNCRPGDAPPQELFAFSDFAVLYRTNEQGRLIAEVLEKAGWPCQLASRDDWLQQQTAARLLALVRLTADLGGWDDFALISELARPMLDNTLRLMFKQWALIKRLPLAVALQTAQRLPLSHISRKRQRCLVQFIRFVGALKKEVKKLSLQQAIAFLGEQLPAVDAPGAVAIERLTLAAESYGSDTAAFLADLALRRDNDFYHPRAEKIALLTMHAAKGLEFPVVFIAGCEAGLIPYSRPGSITNIDEERRLFYVAMTRAGRRLFLSWAGKRRRFGELSGRPPSPFLHDIDVLLKEFDEAPPRRPPQIQLELFKP